MRGRRVHVEQGGGAAAHLGVRVRHGVHGVADPLDRSASRPRCRTGRSSSPRTGPGRRATVSCPAARRADSGTTPRVRGDRVADLRALRLVGDDDQGVAAARREVAGRDLLAGDRVRFAGEGVRVAEALGAQLEEAEGDRRPAPAPWRPRRCAGGGRCGVPYGPTPRARWGRPSRSAGSPARRSSGRRSPAGRGRASASRARATATPMAATGPRPRVEFISAASSTSMLSTTVAPDARTAGPARCRARAIASWRSSWRRSSSR